MRRVKFKYLGVIPYECELVLRTGECIECNRPNEILESCSRLGVYYVLEDKGKYREYINYGDKWVKRSYLTDGDLLSIDFNGYHRHLNDKEINSLNNVNFRYLSKYWSNLRYIQNLNMTLRLSSRRLFIDKKSIFSKRNVSKLSINSLYMTTKLDRFY